MLLVATHGASDLALCSVISCVEPLAGVGRALPTPLRPGTHVHCVGQSLRILYHLVL